MNEKWNLVIDLEKCNGCYNCAIAAKDEYVGNSEVGYFAPQPRHGHDWIGVEQRERGQFPVVDVTFVPMMCNHCDDAPCMKVAKNDAIRKRPDGILIIDPEKSRGQRAIVDACPYGAVFWNEELQIPQHWPFDAHLLDRGWAVPRCVEVCATGAIQALKVDDGTMKEIAASQNLSVRHPEYRTGSRVHYKNLCRAESEFVAGTIVTSVDDKIECAVGAIVELYCEETLIAAVESDAFGDFRFQGLRRGSGPYRIRIAWNETSSEAYVDTLASSRYIGKVDVTAEP